MTTYAKWDAKNASIIAWLLYSMEPQISDNYLCLGTVKQVWDVVSQVFSLVENIPCLYE